MTKDGLAEKVKRDLKRLYDSTTEEPLPDWANELLKKLD